MKQPFRDDNNSVAQAGRTAALDRASGPSGQHENHDPRPQRLEIRNRSGFHGPMQSTPKKNKADKPMNKQPALVSHTMIIGKASEQQKQIEGENIDRTCRLRPKWDEHVANGTALLKPARARRTTCAMRRTIADGPRILWKRTDRSRPPKTGSKAWARTTASMAIAMRVTDHRMVSWTARAKADS